MLRLADISSDSAPPPNELWHNFKYTSFPTILPAVTQCSDFKTLVQILLIKTLTRVPLVKIQVFVFNT